MLAVRRCFSCTCVLGLLFFHGNGAKRTESQARRWFNEYNEKAENVYAEVTYADWNYATNITDHNEQLTVDKTLKAAQFQKDAARNASQFNWKDFRDPLLKRLFSKIVITGTSAMKNRTKYERMKELKFKMESVYHTGKICLSSGKCITLSPGLIRLFATSTDYDELAEVWKAWRDATGRAVKQMYVEFVQLSNEAIMDLGFKDTGEYWRSAYTTPDSELVAVVDRLFEQIKPLYEHLHTYVRRKLKKKYGESRFSTNGHIPAHLLGNIWANHWNSVPIPLQPYPSFEYANFADSFTNQDYDVKKMFVTAEDFFVSLGFQKLPSSFWRESMFRKPVRRKVSCSPSAWDFLNGRDFRIKMCTDVTMGDFVTVHHEMGHIYYFLQYKLLPVTFKSGANPGFHEALGDTIALSVQSVSHLNNIGLVDELDTSEESEVNFLMQMALQKIALLPYAYIMDKWRWGVFSGATPPINYNKKWWELRCKYQGLSSPVPRSEDDFDPGAKFHIPGNVPYIRYFVSHIIQFQFHKALCEAAGHVGPLYRCDIYQSKEAGNLLRGMMNLGSSVPWQDAMEKITGQRIMDATALLEYFRPLQEWLEKENKAYSDNVGWSDECGSSSAFIKHIHTYKMPIISTLICLAYFMYNL